MKKNVTACNVLVLQFGFSARFLNLCISVDEIEKRHKLEPDVLHLHHTMVCLILVGLLNDPSFLCIFRNNIRAMTRVSPEYGDEVQAVWTVSADVSFQTNQFPKYKLGPNNEILDEIKEDSKGPPLKEVVVEEINQLTEQHKRLSVRDLASKFDKSLAAAAKLSEEVFF